MADIPWCYIRAGRSESGTNLYARVTEVGTEQPYVTQTQAKKDAWPHGGEAQFFENEAEARAIVRLPLLKRVREHLADLHELFASHDDSHEAIATCPCHCAIDYRKVKFWIHQLEGR